MTQKSRAARRLFIENQIRIANERFIMPRFGRLAADEVIDAKSMIDVVTIADQEAEAYLTEILEQEYAGSKVIGEEQTTA